MDELTIDDKKYISSKRAAQITGYAKDYVGQLCREGYVEARRVGRNWYVLESAIRDHRFGSPPHQEPPKAPATGQISHVPAQKPLQKAWEPPKYESIKAEPLPSINRLRDTEEGDLPLSPASEAAHPASGQSFHEAWQTWFDTFRTGEEKTEELEKTHENPEGLVLVPVGEVEPEPVSADWDRGEETVPIHTLPHTHESLSRHGLLAHKAPEIGILETRMEDVMPRPPMRREVDIRPRGPLYTVMSLLLVLVILVSIGTAVIGTGKFDSMVISDKRVSALAGIIVYKKI